MKVDEWMRMRMMTRMVRMMMRMIKMIYLK